MKTLPCKHAEAARAMAIAWRDHGALMGGVSDAAAIRARVREHGLRCARFLKLARQDREWAAKRPTRIEGMFQNRVLARVFARRDLAHGRPQAECVGTGDHFSS